MPKSLKSQNYTSIGQNNEIIFNKMRDYFYKIILDKIKRYIFKENYLQFDKLFLKEIRSCRIGANTR